MKKLAWLPYLLILGAGTLWGCTFPLALIATADGASPVTLTAFQVALTAVIFASVNLVVKKPIFQWRHLPVYCILAGLGIIAPDLLYYNGAPHLSAGILSITISTVPMFTYAIMLAFRFEKFLIIRAMGILFGMIAIVLLVVPDQGLSSTDASLWILVVVVCALCYAIENVYLGEVVDDSISIFELLSGSNIVATVIMLPTFALPDYSVPLSWFLGTDALAIIAICVSSSCAYFMFFYTIKTYGPVFASQCAYVITVSGVILGIIVFAESHTIWVWMSLVILLIGLSLVSPREGRSDPESNLQRIELS